MGKKTITVFTPTFNRAHLLPRLYESLCAQTSQDFIWLVIDDGSSDGTEELVKQWRAENIIQIEYRYKENGGMHTGHNLAYQVIETELNVCIDSDDYMPKDAIEKIISSWIEIKDKNQVAGIIGLDADFENNILGTEMPKSINRGTLTDLYQKYKAKGDKKLVLRTDVVRQYPEYPEYPDEKLVPLGSLYILIDQEYNCIYLNEILCNVEYQPQGSTMTIFKQYKQSPRGFAYARKIKLKYYKKPNEIIKNCIHLISCGITSKSIRIVFNDNPYKLLTIFLFPIGILLNVFIRYKTKQGV